MQLREHRRERWGLGWIKMRERTSLRMMEIGDEDESGEMEADGILESGELIVNWTGIYDIILSVQRIEIDEHQKSEQR